MNPNLTGNIGPESLPPRVGLHDLRLVEMASVDSRMKTPHARSIKRALELGINFFDTADMYSRGESERVLGRAMKDFGPGRDRVVVATKVFFPVDDGPNQKGLSRKHIMQAIDDSLQRLEMDYVDLYQIHRFDYETPIEETLEALNDVVKAGKARYIGASSMHAWQFAKMLYTADRLGADAVLSPCRTTTTSCIARKSAK